MQKQKQYMLVGRSEISAMFKKGDVLEVSPSNVGDLTFYTKYSDLGFEVPVPTGMVMEAQVSASTVNEAVEKSGDAIQVLKNVVELSVNAWLGDLEVELVYELFPGPGKREYFQCLVPQMPVMMVPGRVVNLPAAIELIAKIYQRNEKRRLVQAIAQYHEALRHWSRGSELVCVSHIFMGIESLKNAVLREHLRKTGQTLEELGREWGYKEGKSQELLPFLEAQARLRLIFLEDAKCHKCTKTVSDGFEHGFENLGVLKRSATQVVVSSAKYLRLAILKYSGISDTSYNLLSSDAYVPRGPLRLIKYLWGSLESDTEQLAPSGSKHPHCNWNSKISRVFIDEKGNYAFSPAESCTAMIGPGVILKPERHEAWDGSTIIEQPDAKTGPST